MSRFELSLSPDYVPNWGFAEALREIFQNAMDQETVDPENKMSYGYIAEDRCFTISSKESSLNKASLLLGNSTKTADETTVGKFGEGYKIALLVLCRLGYEVVIHNYKEKEVWTPKIINSRRYDSKLLVVDVKKHIFTSVPNSNLTFAITDVEPDVVSEVSKNFLFMQQAYKSISTEHGEVLFEEKHKGKIFVNGLFVQNVREDVIKYGYNFKPGMIDLDRDRSMVDAFNVNWQSSKVWTMVKDKDLVSECINKGFPDVKFLSNFPYRHEVIDHAFDSFQATHGLDAIPVYSQEEIDECKTNYPSLKTVVVDSYTRSNLSESTTLKELKENAKITCKTKSKEDIIENMRVLMSEYDFDLVPDFVEGMNEAIDQLEAINE